MSKQQNSRVTHFTGSRAKTKPRDTLSFFFFVWGSVNTATYGDVCTKTRDAHTRHAATIFAQHSGDTKGLPKGRDQGAYDLHPNVIVTRCSLNSCAQPQLMRASTVRPFAFKKKKTQTPVHTQKQNTFPQEYTLVIFFFLRWRRAGVAIKQQRVLCGAFYNT